MNSLARRVFISYSHIDKDVVWKDRVVLQLHALAKEGKLEIWDDQRIASGNDWRLQLKQAIQACHVALLLISPDFLTSDFVTNVEVPALLDRRVKEGIRVIPVILRPCPWEQVSWLKGIQVWPKDGRALSLMRRHSFEASLSALAKEVLGGGTTDEINTTDRLLALGFDLCSALARYLENPYVENEIVSEHPTQPGVIDFSIDFTALDRGRQVVEEWGMKHEMRVGVVGENCRRTWQDLLKGNPPPQVVCQVDALDGSDHYVSGLNLFCSAFSLFEWCQADKRYRLKVSMVLHPDWRPAPGADRPGWRVFYACEGEKASYVKRSLDSSPERLTVSHDEKTKLDNSRACTVCRRVGHWERTVKLLTAGSPFLVLNSFGGNPALVWLADQKYDIVFQADPGDVKKLQPQPLWDYLPGMHVAEHANCTLLSLDNKSLTVAEVAERIVHGEQEEQPYVASTNLTLAEQTARWLKPFPS